MKASLRHRLSPVAGVVTLAIGLGLVVAIQMFAALLSGDQSESLDQPLIIRSSDISGPVTPLRMELSCYDPHILPVWHELKDDTNFKEGLRFADGRADCSEMLEVRKLDLNRDGKDEFLVRGKGTLVCGGTGNCGYWIFESRGKGVNKLLSAVHEGEAYEFGVDEVQKSRFRNYPEILLANHDAQNVLHFQTYRFNGREYAPQRCMSEVPKPLRDGAGSWELVTCEEFYRMRDEMRKELVRLANRKG